MLNQYAIVFVQECPLLASLNYSHCGRQNRETTLFTLTVPVAEVTDSA